MIKKRKKRKNFDFKYKIIITAIALLALFFLLISVSKSFMVRGQVNDVSEFNFIAYDGDFSDEIDIACIDIDGDNKDEISTIAKYKNIIDFRIFNEKGDLLESFKDKTGKNQSYFNIAAGDVDGDGKEEIMAVSDMYNSQVKIFKDKKNILKFKAFKDTDIGATIASGDVNSDGKDEIIVGAGKGGGPQVKVFNEAGKELSSFFAFNPLSRSGINVVTGNIDEDLQEEVIVSQKYGGQGLIKMFKYDNLKSYNSAIIAYPKTENIGANIYSGNLNDDNKVEIIAMRDEEEGDLDLKIFSFDGTEINIFKNGLKNNIKNKKDLDICNFNNKKGVVTTQNFENKQKVIVLYE